MPRTNRISRAIDHPDTFTGCIMLVQEGIRFTRRAVARWTCPELEEELRWLQEQHDNLQVQYQFLRSQSERYQQRTQARLHHYREELHNLLFAHSRRLSSHSRQTVAFRAEIAALRNMVRVLEDHIASHNIPMVEYPANAESPWQYVHQYSWQLSVDWARRHPGESPSYDPNDSPNPNQ